MNNSARKSVPLYKRLEYSSVGVMIGSAIVLLWGIFSHSNDSQSAGIRGLSISIICFIVLRLANHSRASQP